MFTTVDHRFLQILELFVESVAKVINAILPFKFVLGELDTVDFCSKLELPVGDV
jgi:hypothetical protein